eukprot:scaffold23413_cov129-Isochrysis_galbana.AAC.1
MSPGGCCGHMPPRLRGAEQPAAQKRAGEARGIGGREGRGYRLHRSRTIKPRTPRSHPRSVPRSHDHCLPYCGSPPHYHPHSPPRCGSPPHCGSPHSPQCGCHPHYCNHRNRNTSLSPGLSQAPSSLRRQGGRIRPTRLAGSDCTRRPRRSRKTNRWSPCWPVRAGRRLKRHPCRCLSRFLALHRPSARGPPDRMRKRRHRRGAAGTASGGRRRKRGGSWRSRAPQVAGARPRPPPVRIAGRPGWRCQRAADPRQTWPCATPPPPRMRAPPPPPPSRPCGKGRRWREAASVS